MGMGRDSVPGATTVRRGTRPHEGRVSDPTVAWKLGDGEWHPHAGLGHMRRLVDSGYAERRSGVDQRGWPTMMYRITGKGRVLLGTSRGG
jgi:predicted ArsR family transcriptional regulator